LQNAAGIMAEDCVAHLMFADFGVIRVGGELA
jgi:hypothetical protein